MDFEQKHEPQHFAELVFADPIVRATCQRYATGKPYKSLMLWGPPGTAKTITARVIVRERYRAAGYNGDIHEYNGADIKSGDLDHLVHTASFLDSCAGDALMIINEIDEFDRDMQAKFRSWMDKWKWINLIVTTNERPGVQGVRQKLMPAFQSRFELVELAPPSLQDFVPRVQAIMQREGFTVNAQAVQALLSTFKGDIRQMLPLVEEGVEQLRKAQQPQPPQPSLTVVSAKPGK